MPLIPLIMGIVNLTPDSFSDGGLLQHASGEVDVAAAVAFARGLVDQGADILDIGGESTRPGSTPVPVSEELKRVLPVVEALGTGSVPISIDTRNAEVARRAVEAGAAIINDISGLTDPSMARVAAESGAGLVLGHLRGAPQTMQRHVAFDDLFSEVCDELMNTAAKAQRAGVSQRSIMLDPGVGFGKTAEQSAALVGSSQWFEARTGYPVLIGASRKRFLSQWAPVEASQRQIASVAAAVVAARHGAAVVRVHDVAETKQALAVVAGIERQLAHHGGDR